MVKELIAATLDLQNPINTLLNKIKLYVKSSDY